jgi:uncharacterized protein (DUF488 family)
MEFFTIGVYNTTEKDFFDKLIQNNIDTFCDIRQRRLVRGVKYAFVNSNRLQQKLLELDIKYFYVSELAPTAEIRELQKNTDKEKGETKRKRQLLGNIFAFEYEKQILDTFDFDNFIEKLNQSGAVNVALFCVEEKPEACHRSLVAEKLKNMYNYKIKG